MAVYKIIFASGEEIYVWGNNVVHACQKAQEYAKKEKFDSDVIYSVEFDRDLAA